MRFFQLTSQARLALRDPSKGEEAILEVTRQNGTVLQVFERLPLGVQQPLYSLDDVVAMGQEELEKLDVGLKRHLAEKRPAWQRYSHPPLRFSTGRIRMNASTAWILPS